MRTNDEVLSVRLGVDDHSLCFGNTGTGGQSYGYGCDRCKVIAVTPKDADDLELLTIDDQMDFWSEPSPMMTDVAIQVCKEAEENLTAQLRAKGMNPTVNIHDLKMAGS